MVLPRSTLQYVCGLLLVVACSEALKLDLTATHEKKERCIRNYVGKDTLVVVTATVGGTKGDGQSVNMHVSGGNSIGLKETRY